MLTRIRGIILLMNTLIPLFFILLLSSGIWFVYTKLQPPLQQIQETVQRINLNASNTYYQSTMAFQNITAPLSNVRDKIDDAAIYLQSIPSKLPDLAIPSLNLPINPEIERLDEYPWFYLEMKPVLFEMPSIDGPEIEAISETKTTFSSVLNIMESITGVVDAVATLNQFENDIFELALAVSELNQRIIDGISTIATYVKWIVVFLLFWIVFSYIFWTIRRISESLRMIFTGNA